VLGLLSLRRLAKMESATASVSIASVIALATTVNLPSRGPKVDLGR
jgi:hypothetical protein